MSACGPFEDTPHIAIALSGGPDSLALTQLLAAWVAQLGGILTALTVDHGMRAEAEAEARQVGQWMQRSGITHHILKWEGDKPTTGIMAAARTARYDLLRNWCQDNAVLHLALGHHREDQAATFLMRLKRGSGLQGLACMSPTVDGFPRLLRPLLDMPRARLAATLKATGQNWIEDPSNENPAYERNPITDFIDGGNSIGLTAERVSLAAKSLTRAKDAITIDIAKALAHSVSISPLGVAVIDTQALLTYPDDIQLRALSRIVQTIGGADYTPRLDRLTRLLQSMKGSNMAMRADDTGKGRTLAGCCIRGQNGGHRIIREAAAIAPDQPVTAPNMLWDRRFYLQLPEAMVQTETYIGRLTQERWQALKKICPTATTQGIPADVRCTLPVIWDILGIMMAPHYGYTRQKTGEKPQISFQPVQYLT